MGYRVSKDIAIKHLISGFKPTIQKLGAWGLIHLTQQIADLKFSASK